MSETYNVFLHNNRRAVSLVKNNLGLGILLAIGALWFFLRDRRATLIIAATIPISLMAAFISLQIFGLSLNVISLAGIAFSVGLVCTPTNRNSI